MSFIKRHWGILIITLLGLTPLLWFEPGYIIARGDFFPHWLNSLNTFHHDIFTWSLPNGGSPTTWPAYLIVGFLWYILQLLQIPPSVIQIIFQILYFLGAGLAMFYLTSSLLQKQKIAAFIASVFYMFNLFMLQSRFTDAISWTLVFLPLLLGLYVKIVEKIDNKQSTIKYNVCFIITSTILLSFSSINPTLLVLSILSLLLMFLYYLIFKSDLRFKLIKSLIILGGLGLLANIWWIIPIFQQYFSPTQSSGIVTDVTQWSWTNARSSFLNLFQLNGLWSWTPHVYPYIDAYTNPIMTMLCFIPVIIAFIGMLFKGYTHKTFICFSSGIALIMIFLQKGLHEPLANVNLFLYQHIPFSSAFRTPTDKFGLVLIVFLALLIGLSSDSILEFIQNTKSNLKNLVYRVFVLFLITAFLISAFPLFTMKEVLAYDKPPSDFPYSSYVNIPSYWYEASDWINTQGEDGRILLTPNQSLYGPYSWGYYGTGELPTRLIMKPILQSDFGYNINKNYSAIISELYKSITEGNSAKFHLLLRAMNVKYILQCNDVEDTSDNKIISTHIIKNFLNNQPDIHLFKVFGLLDLYKLDSVNPPSHIYIPQNVSLFDGSLDELFQKNSTNDINQISSDIFLWTQVNSNQNQIIQNYIVQRDDTIPQISFQIINPTQYEIKITNAKRPFFMIFSENFDPQWKAYIGIDRNIKWFQALFSAPISDENHFKINGYANAWYIDPGKERTSETLNITIYYKSQSYFYLGCTISGITILGCLAILFVKWVKRRQKSEML